MIVTYTCPPCGKRVPGGESGGHCSKCHENFRGDAAFDRHLVRHRENGSVRRITCQNPAETVTPTGKPLDYWQDNKGVWHLGPRDPRFTKEPRP